MEFENLDKRIEFFQPKRHIVRLADEITDGYSTRDRSTRDEAYSTNLVRGIAIALVLLLLPVVAVLALKNREVNETNGWKLTSTSFTPRSVEPLYLKDISALAVSPKKQWIAFGDAAGHLRVVDYDFDQEIALPGCSSAITSIAWSVDSQKIAIGTVDGSMITYDRETGVQRLVTQLDQPYRIEKITFCDNDDHLAAISNKSLLLVDLASDSVQINPLFSAASWEMVADDFGQRLAIYGTNAIAGVHKGVGSLFVYDCTLEGGSFLEVDHDGNDRMITFDWSDDGQQLLGVAKSGHLYRWTIFDSESQLESKFQIQESLTNGEPVLLDAFGGSSVRLAVGNLALDIEGTKVVQQTSLDPKFQRSRRGFGKDGELCFVQNGIRIVADDGRLLREHIGPYCAEAKKVFCVGPDSFVVLDSEKSLSLISDTDRTRLTGHDEVVSACFPNPNNPNELLVSSNLGLFVFDVETGARESLSLESGLRRLEWHPKLPLVAGLETHRLVVVNLEDGQVTIPDLPCSMQSFAWHPETAEIVMGPVDYRALSEPGNRWVHNGIYIWTPENPEINYLELPEAELRERVTVSFNPMGQTVVAGSTYAQLVVFDWLEQGQGFELAGRNQKVPQHIREIQKFLWHPADEKRFFSTSKDGSLCEWDLAANSVVERYQFHRNVITALELSHAGDSVCSVDGSGNLFVWDVDSPEERNYCRIPWPINDVAWDTTDRYLMVCHSLGVTKVNIATMSIGSSVFFQEDGGQLILEQNSEPTEDSLRGSPFRSRASSLSLAMNKKEQPYVDSN